MNEENSPSYYSIIPADLRYDNRLNANEKLLFSEISALTNACGYCYAKNKYFVNLYECDVRTIQRWLHNLEKLKYIKVDLIRDEKNNILERRIYTRESLNILDQIYNQTSIENDRIYPSDKNVTTPGDKNVMTPSDKNAIYNNIYINNILHNKGNAKKEEYTEKVFLEKEQYEELKKSLGEEKLEKCLTELSLYKKSKNVEYADDYSAIRRWVIDKINQKEKVEQNNKYKPYRRREYEDLSEFYDN